MHLLNSKYFCLHFRYNVEWIGREGLAPETHEEYLNDFINHFYKNVLKLVDRAMRKEDTSAQGKIVTEILQHLHACGDSVKVFYGRVVRMLFSYKILWYFFNARPYLVYAFLFIYRTN